MKHLGTITIDTPRLILRRFCEEDIELAFCNWTSDPEVTTFLRWPTHRDIAVTRMVLTDWITSYEKPDFYQWAIVPKELGQPIGSITVVELDEKIEKVHVGYCIGSKWWHMGYTSEAFAALIPFFFEEMGANRVESQHDPENPFSGKVMEKCGLTYEGTLRQNDFSNRGIVDAAMYGILRSEYFERKNPS